MRISDWSSDVCSSDLLAPRCLRPAGTKFRQFNSSRLGMDPMTLAAAPDPSLPVITHFIDGRPRASSRPLFENRDPTTGMVTRSEEHTSELQSLMRISYAVICLKKKKNKQYKKTTQSKTQTE